MKLFYKQMESPVGKLKLVANSHALVAVLWEREHPKRVRFDTAARSTSAAADYTGDRAPAGGIFLRPKSSRSIFPLEPDGSEFQKKSLAGS